MKSVDRTWRRQAFLVSAIGFVGCATQPEVMELDVSVTDVTVEPSGSILGLVASRQLTAIATWSDESTEDITALADWASSDGAVATVGSAGEVSTLAEGVAEISAMFSGVTGSATVQVVDARSLEFDPLPELIVVDGSGPTALYGRSAGGDRVDLTLAATYESSAPQVATISNDDADRGAITALAPGEVTFTGTFGELSATLGAEIVSRQPLIVEPADPTLQVGETEDLVVWARWLRFEGEVHPSSQRWESSNPSVATVDASGTVTAVAPGTATIIARLAVFYWASWEVTTTVTVVDRPAADAWTLAVATSIGIETFSLVGGMLERGPVVGTGIPPRSLHFDVGLEWMIAPRLSVAADVMVLQRDPDRAFTQVATVDVEGVSIAASAYDDAHDVLSVVTIGDQGVRFYSREDADPYLTSITGPLDGESFFAFDVDGGPMPGGERFWAALGNGALGLRGWRMGAQSLEFTELSGSGFEPRTPSVELHVDPWGSGCMWTLGDLGFDAFQIDHDGDGMTPLPDYPVTTHGARGAATTEDGRLYLSVADGSLVYGYRFDASCAIEELAGSPWETDLGVIEELAVAPGGEALFAMAFDPDTNTDSLATYDLGGAAGLALVGQPLPIGDFGRAMAFF